MTAILRQMTDYHYQRYIDNFDTLTDLSDFLMEILTAIEELVTSSVYPADWNEMILLQNWSVLLVVVVVSVARWSNGNVSDL